MVRRLKKSGDGGVVVGGRKESGVIATNIVTVCLMCTGHEFDSIGLLPASMVININAGHSSGEACTFALYKDF